MKKTVALLILDGWGIREEIPGNTIKLAEPTYYDSLLAKYPNIALDASGEAVGLPEGQMGNSEVGHLNIGAGRVVYQDLVKVNLAISDHSLHKNAVLKETIEYVKKNCEIGRQDGLAAEQALALSRDIEKSLIAKNRPGG